MEPLTANSAGPVIVLRPALPNRPEGGRVKAARLKKPLPESMESPEASARPEPMTPVPLESDAKGRSTLFFLVPYPGACIHVPPPPPNQLVLVRYPKGLKLDDIYTPLWVTGTLKVEKVSNDLADAAYALDAGKVRVVKESDL